MQSKGIIKFVAILLLIASLFQLSFTFVANRYEKKADQYAQEKIAKVMQDSAYLAKAGYATMTEEDQDKFVEKELAAAKREYIDTKLGDKKIYCGYNIKAIQAKSINLGLDLKGGMSVMLQVQVKDVVNALAKNKCEEFTKAFDAAAEKSIKSKENFIDLFKAERGTRLSLMCSTCQDLTKRSSSLSRKRLPVQSIIHTGYSADVSTVSASLSQISRK